MPTFNVEIIHEPTGEYMNFTAEFDEYDYNEPITEENVWQIVLDDLSIVCEEVGDLK